MDGRYPIALPKFCMAKVLRCRQIELLIQCQLSGDRQQRFNDRHEGAVPTGSFVATSSHSTVSTQTNWSGNLDREVEQSSARCFTRAQSSYRPSGSISITGATDLRAAETLSASPSVWKPNVRHLQLHDAVEHASQADTLDGDAGQR